MNGKVEAIYLVWVSVSFYQWDFCLVGGEGVIQTPRVCTASYM